MRFSSWKFELFWAVSSSASTPAGGVVMHRHAKTASPSASTCLCACLKQGPSERWDWPRRALQQCPSPAAGPLQTDPSLPGSLLQQSLLIEKHFRKNFINLRSIKVRREDSCFVLYCLNNLALILLHESVADWALLSSKDSSSTVGNCPAFTGAGNHSPPLPPSSLDSMDNYTSFYALLNQNAIS